MITEKRKHKILTCVGGNIGNLCNTLEVLRKKKMNTINGIMWK